jgi:hypothetical protein
MGVRHLRYVPAILLVVFALIWLRSLSSLDWLQFHRLRLSWIKGQVTIGVVFDGVPRVGWNALEAHTLAADLVAMLRNSGVPIVDLKVVRVFRSVGSQCVEPLGFVGVKVELWFLTTSLAGLSVLPWVISKTRRAERGFEVIALSRSTSSVPERVNHQPFR